MAFRTPKLVKRTRHGIELQLGAEERQLLGGLVAEMRELLRTDDDPGLRRLYPTAYPDDPEREAEYQLLARTELADHRQQVLDTMEASLGAKLLDSDQVTAWVQGINQIRLVLGTRLDVDEDEPEFDPEAPDAPARAVYAYLAMLLDQFVDALST
jgi:hypothetical protein